MSLRITKPPALRVRVANYALGTYKVFIDSMVIKTLEGAHWIGNQTL
jgi:hypothetical protein